MYGTMYRMRPQAGQEQAVVTQFRRWSQERQPHATGYIASYALQSESSPDDIVGIVIFDSQANYTKNAADPGQEAYYQHLRALLANDPIWEDGEISEMVSEPHGL